MKKEIYEEMIKTPTGVSSTSVMAWDTWKFTKIWMVIFLVILTALFVVDGLGKIDVDIDVLNGLIKVYVWTVVILLVATYTPKSIAKFAEAWQDKIFKK